jgi:hypothetical protein
MAQQTPDPKLIDSMAMRYRHDFGLLEEPHKEAIRTTMKQLWEEVVGLGFYKDKQFGNSEQLAQQTAVEWLEEQFLRERFVYDFDFDKAKEMFQQQIEDAQMDMFYKNNNIPFGMHYLIKRDEALKYTEQYYTQTYGK